MQLSTAREQDRGWTPARENTEAGSDSNAGKRTLVEGAGKLCTLEENAADHTLSRKKSDQWNRGKNDPKAIQCRVKRSCYRVCGYLADWLEFFVFWIVTCQEIASVWPSPFTFTKIPANHYHIQRISYTGQIVLLQLKEIKQDMSNLSWCIFRDRRRERDYLLSTSYANV